MKDNKVYIVILNYNGWRDTLECLESVLRNQYDNYQIIVVDNASTNSSMENMLSWAGGRLSATCDNLQLEDLTKPEINKPIAYDFYTDEQVLSAPLLSDKKLIFIQSSNNGGFAAGNNLAIKYIQQKNDYKYIWLLNNDTVIQPDSLVNLVKYAEDSNAGITGSSLFYYHNPNMIQAYGGMVNKFFGTSSHILGSNDIYGKLDYIIGAAFLINKNVIDKIGLLPEEYFLYYEETDYCFNAKNNGFKLGIALDSIVYHKEGGSTGASQDASLRSEFSDVLALKNRIKFHRKYLGGGIGLWLGLGIAFLNRIRRNQIRRIFLVLRSK